MKKLRDYLYLGTAAFTGEPILLLSFILAHIHALGGTGSGKTHRFLVALIRQLARLGWSIIYIDMKKDAAAVRTLDWIAETEGIPHKVFTSDPRERSWLWNPFDNLEGLTDDECAEIILGALGLDYGEGYGESFFSASNKRIITRGIVEWKPRSFADMAARFNDPAERRKLKLSDREWENGSHAVMAAEGLAAVGPLSYGPDDVPASVYEDRIKLAPALEEPGIRSFVLPTMTRGITNRGIARSALHNAVALAGLRPDRGKPTLVVLDDCDQVMTKSLSTLAAQCRDRNIVLVFVHQSMSQLKTKDHDYVPEVVTNSRCKIYFGPFTDRDAYEIVSRISGEKKRYIDIWGDRGWSQSEQYAPRIGVEELKDVGRVPGRAIVDVRPGDGLTQFTHPVIVDLPFTMSPEEFDAICARSWPGKPEETIIAADYKPPEPPPKPTPEEREESPILKKLKRAK